ncbi:LPS O-antigen chain length determinant protein WzzB [Aeromonas allosaccharophila]|uniref:LPS O-antigen chain length determinant protein WzzB n=1 Tax=Aeromonas allosaccharophila TaxID=656 RepID=UPI0039876FF3
MEKEEVFSMPDTHTSQGRGIPSDEINLQEIVLVLWHQKFLILIITTFFAVIGVGYALFAPQQWSTKAVITAPKPEDLLPMRKIAVQADALGLQGFPSGEVLYQEFIQEFNAYENRRDYLKASPLFAQQAEELGLDDKAHRRWLRDWAQLISAAPLDKKGEVPGIAISFSAPTAEGSLMMLEGYIDYIIKLQQKRLVYRLNEERSLQLEGVSTRFILMQEDAKRALQQDISETALANSIAKAAGVSAPLENYDSRDRFSISLGVKGLDERLALLKSLDIELYKPELPKLKVKMARLKQISLEGITFRPFSYLDAPDEPLSRDKPKRPLVVVLATLLGGMLGSGIVLIRHAFRKPKQA